VPLHALPAEPAASVWRLGCSNVLPEVNDDLLQNHESSGTYRRDCIRPFGNHHTFLESPLCPCLDSPEPDGLTRHSNNIRHLHLHPVSGHSHLYLSIEISPSLLCRPSQAVEQEAVLRVSEVLELQDVAGADTDGSLAVRQRPGLGSPVDSSRPEAVRNRHSLVVVRVQGIREADSSVDRLVVHSLAAGSLEVHAVAVHDIGLAHLAVDSGVLRAELLAALRVLLGAEVRLARHRPVVRLLVRDVGRAVDVHVVGVVDKLAPEAQVAAVAVEVEIQPVAAAILPTREAASKTTLWSPRCSSICLVDTCSLATAVPGILSRASHEMTCG